MNKRKLTTIRTKPRIETGLCTPIETVFEGQGLSDKQILPLLIQKLHTISKTLSIGSRFAVENYVSRADKAISRTCVYQFTTCAEIAATDNGNGWKPVQ